MMDFIGYYNGSTQGSCHFKYSGDGKWIKRRLVQGSLIFVHNESYMPKVNPSLCSVACIVQCTFFGQEARGLVVEQSDASDNYKAEFLGAMCCLLIIKATLTSSRQSGRCKAYYGDKSIIIHCRNPSRNLKERQNQFDLVLLCQTLICNLDLDINCQHVFGHMDNILNWDQLSLPE